MDTKLDCTWKDKKQMEICNCKARKNKTCPCNLEPCTFYKKNKIKSLLLTIHKIWRK